MLGKDVVDLAKEVLRAHAHMVELAQGLVQKISVDGELFSITQSLKGAIVESAKTMNGNCSTIPDLTGRVISIASQDLATPRRHRETADTYRVVDALVMRAVSEATAQGSASISMIVGRVRDVEKVSVDLVKRRVRLLVGKGKLRPTSRGNYRIKR
jgi:citrate lyase beta subunit